MTTIDTAKKWLLGKWRTAFPTATTIKPRMSKVIDGRLFVNRGNGPITVLKIDSLSCQFHYEGNEIIDIEIKTP